MHLTYETPLHHLVLDELAELREAARARREQKDPTPVVYRRAGLTFVVGTGAKAPFRHLLTCEDAMTVAVAGQNHKSAPTLKVEIRSQYLWEHGYVLAVERVRGLVWTLMAGTLDAPDQAGIPGVERVLRVDLAVDFQGWEFDGSDWEEARFRCRATEDGHGKRRRDWTGYSWGLGGDVGFRVYDKTAEIGGQASEALRRAQRAEGYRAHRESRKPRQLRATRAKKSWFPLVVWPSCPDYVDGAPVWRGEAQMRGQVLKELGLRRDFLEVMAHNLDGAWRHVVGAPDWAPERSGGRGAKRRAQGVGRRKHNTQGAWISYRLPCPPDAPNPARIPVDKRWRKLQGVEFVAQQRPLVRVRAREASLERALVGAQGYLSTIAAILRIPVGIGADSKYTRHEACRMLEEQLAKLDATQVRTFNTRVLEKREARDGGQHACAVCNQRAARPPRQTRGGWTIWAVCASPECRAVVAADVVAQRARPLSRHDGRAYADHYRREHEARALATLQPEERCDS